MDTSELIASFLSGGAAVALIKCIHDHYRHKSEEKRAYASFFLKEKAENFLSLAQEIEKLDDAINEYTETVTNEELLELLTAFKSKLRTYKYIFDKSLIREIQAFINYYSKKLTEKMEEKTDTPIENAIYHDFLFVKQKVKQHIPIDYKFKKDVSFKHRYDTNPYFVMHKFLIRSEELNQEKERILEIYNKKSHQTSFDELVEMGKWCKKNIALSFDSIKFCIQIMISTRSVDSKGLYILYKTALPILLLCIRLSLYFLIISFLIVILFYRFSLC